MRKMLSKPTINKIRRNIKRNAMSTTTINTEGLLGLPKDILIMLPDYLHNIEDYMNLSSTCRALRECMQTAHPHTILCLVWESSRTFFRPSPYFVVAATARDLGNWARESDINEAQLASGMPWGIDHLVDMALRVKSCGLTMARIRELHELRFSVINPVWDVVDKCIGKQWRDIPNFWNTVEDAYTVLADVDESLFQLAIYGEIFAPDFEPLFNPSLSGRKQLTVDTRLEFVKYCLDTSPLQVPREPRHEPYDPRRIIIVHPDGPYVERDPDVQYDKNAAMRILINSIRWRPLWRRAREEAGAAPDFLGRLFPDDVWRQALLDNVMQCQGLDGLAMILPGTKAAEPWRPKIKEWREKIEAMEEPPKVEIDIGERTLTTYYYPDLGGDLYVARNAYIPTDS